MQISGLVKKATAGHHRTGSMGSNLGPTLSSLLASSKKDLPSNEALSSLTASQIESSSGLSKGKKKVSQIRLEII